MTSTGPPGDENTGGSTQIIRWKDIRWVVVGAAIVGLLHGLAQDSPLLLTLVIVTIMLALIAGAQLYVSDGWRSRRELGVSILSVLVIDVGFLYGWIIGSGLSELWVVLQLLDDIDFYHHHFPQPTM